MAAVSDLHTLAMPWRKSAHSNTGGCVEIALMSSRRPGFVPALAGVTSVATGERVDREE